MGLVEEKATLRKQMRAARAAINDQDRKAYEDALCERLYNLPALRKAHVIGTYQAFGSEASVHDLVRALRLTGETAFAYPAIQGAGIMHMTRVERGEMPEFVSNPLAVIDPTTIKDVVVDPKNIDVLLVPGVAFDEQRRRLGQSGGYYDRYLEQLSSDCITIGIAFDEQIVEKVPTGVHDRRVKYVVTPSRIIA